MRNAIPLLLLTVLPCFYAKPANAAADAARLECESTQKIGGRTITIMGSIPAGIWPEFNVVVSDGERSLTLTNEEDKARAHNVTSWEERVFTLTIQKGTEMHWLSIHAHPRTVKRVGDTWHRGPIEFRATASWLPNPGYNAATQAEPVRLPRLPLQCRWIRTAG